MLLRSPGGTFVLPGTTLVPGLDSSDYTPWNSTRLSALYPGQEDLMVRFTH